MAILVRDEDAGPSPVFAPPINDLNGLGLAPPGTTPVAAGGHGVALNTSGQLPVTAPATALVILTADPDSPQVGQMWYRSDTSQFCIRHDAVTTKRVLLA